MWPKQKVHFFFHLPLTAFHSWTKMYALVLKYTSLHSQSQITFKQIFWSRKKCPYSTPINVLGIFVSVPNLRQWKSFGAINLKVTSTVFLSSTLRGLYRGMGWSRWSMSWNSWKITGHGHLTFLLNYHSLNSGCRLRVDRSDHQNNSIISLLARQIQWKLDLAEKSVTLLLSAKSRFSAISSGLMY